MLILLNNRMPDEANGDVRPFGPLVVAPASGAGVGSRNGDNDLREPAICGNLCGSKAKSLLNSGAKS
jgi:hypothetical protein